MLLAERLGNHSYDWYAIHWLGLALPCDELAGDSLNVFSLADHQLGLYMLDVSGHGVSAALLSVTLQPVLSPRPNGPSLLFEETDGTGGRPVPPAEVARQYSLSLLMGTLETWCAGSSCGDDISILAVEVVE